MSVLQALAAAKGAGQALQSINQRDRKLDSSLLAKLGKPKVSFAEEQKALDAQFSFEVSQASRRKDRSRLSQLLSDSTYAKVSPGVRASAEEALRTIENEPSEEDLVRSLERSAMRRGVIEEGEAADKRTADQLTETQRLRAEAKEKLDLRKRQLEVQKMEKDLEPNQPGSSSGSKSGSGLGKEVEKKISELHAVNDIVRKELLPSLESPGIKDNIGGMFGAKGFLTETMIKATGGSSAPPGFTAFQSKLHNAADLFLRIRTGAQANESEIEVVLNKILGGVSLNAETLREKFNSFIRVNEITIDAYGRGGAPEALPQRLNPDGTFASGWTRQHEQEYQRRFQRAIQDAERVQQGQGGQGVSPAPADSAGASDAGRIREILKSRGYRFDPMTGKEL